MGYTVLDFAESIDRVNLAGGKPVHVRFAWGDGPGQSEWEGAFIFEMDNGKWALLSGWCDYTGWGCQDDATVSIYDTLEELLLEGPNSEMKAPFLELQKWDESPTDLNRWIQEGMPNDRIWEWS